PTHLMHLAVAAGCESVGSACNSGRWIRPVPFARYSAQELATASESLFVGTFGDVDRRTADNGLRRRWRRNKIKRNAASYRGGSAFWTSVDRHQAAVWKC